MEEMEEMLTDESGSINAIRRQELSLFTIISEILGNLQGSVISIKVNESTLYVFVDDGGMTEKDKGAVRRKYSSGSYNTSGINGIGIRMAIDRISSDNNIILRTINERESIKLKIGMPKDSPKWVVSKWVSFDEQDKINYQDYISGLNLTDNKGTLWEIPLNDEYTAIFKKDNDTVKNICRRFFNIPLKNKELKLFVNSEELKIDIPLYSDKEDKCVELEITLFHEGNSPGNGKRVWKITNYDDVKDKYPDLKEYYTVNGSSKQVQEYVRDTQELTEYERFRAKIVSYSSETFKKIEKSLRANSEKMKGLWLSINGMCILEESIIRGSGQTDYINKQYYPIIELHIEKDTKLFDLTSDKSKTKEKKGDGEKIVKLLWYLMKGLFPIPPDPTKTSDTADQTNTDMVETTAIEPVVNNEESVDVASVDVASVDVTSEGVASEDVASEDVTTDSDVVDDGVLVGPEVDNGNCMEELVDNGDSEEDELDYFYICYIVRDPLYAHTIYIPDNIKEKYKIRSDLDSVYKYGKLKIKNQDKGKIAQRLIESYARGRAVPMQIIKYWIINGDGSDAENSIKGFLRGHKLVVDNSCELFNIKDYDGNIDRIIQQIKEHLISANYLNQ